VTRPFPASRAILSPRLPSVFVAAALAIALASPRRAAAQQRPATPTAAAVRSATITGTIVDEGGLVVEGAKISLVNGGSSAVSATNGAFRLTEVPPGKASLTVAKEGFGLLTFEFDIAAGVTVALKLTIESVPPPMSSSDDAESTDAVSEDTSAAPGSRFATLAGRVVDSAGVPLFGVTVDEAGSKLRTMTDSTGRFRLSGLSPGLQMVRARKVGYLPEYFPATTVMGKVTTAAIRLRPAGQQLARVEVKGDAFRGNVKMQGFYERAALGQGVFVTRDEILKRNTTQISDVLRGRNGINVIGGGGGNGATIAGRMLKMAGGQGPGICVLPLILDGVLIEMRNGATVDQFVNVQDVQGIEVYTSGPQVPGSLAMGNTDCGAIVVWTR
jgi:protocatechuate 3,4-dioxygenase beta subunit